MAYQKARVDGRVKIQPGCLTEILARRLSGETLESLAEEFGVSRERIRQVLLPELEARGIDPHSIPNRDRQARRQRREELRLERAGRRRTCRVCGLTFVPYSNEVTCSSACSTMWRDDQVKMWLDPKRYDQHRIHHARSILKHQDKRSPSQVEWAHRMLSDNPPPPNRRYFVKSTAAKRRRLGIFTIQDLELPQAPAAG